MLHSSTLGAVPRFELRPPLDCYGRDELESASRLGHLVPLRYSAPQSSYEIEVNVTRSFWLRHRTPDGAAPGLIPLRGCSLAA